MFMLCRKAVFKQFYSIGLDFFIFKTICMQHFIHEDKAFFVFLYSIEAKKLRPAELLLSIYLCR